MKLNNKGFAFSTLLYGILAVIILVLMVIFALYSSANNQSYYYAQVFEENLNKCVDQEIALQNCYGAGNTCDEFRKAYYACLGLDDKAADGKKVSFKTTLQNKKVTSGNGLYQLSSGDNLAYEFRGDVVKNYVSFSGTNWRVIGITKLGEIKIGLFDYTENLSWDNANECEWSVASLNNYLNGTFFNNLSDGYMIVKSNFNIGRLSVSTNHNSSDIIANERNATHNSNVGLPNVSDYVKASLISTCNSNIIDNSNCTSWMSGSDSWLLSAGENSSHKAYYFKAGAGVKRDATNTAWKFVPVVHLSPDTTIIEGAGDGSSSQPYVLGR